MPIDATNSEQAQLWRETGPMWVALREQFDAQSGAHGTAAIERLDPRSGERIVDIGCGPGSTTIELARRVGGSGSVTGLDISPTMIEGAQTHAAALGVTNVDFRVGDAMVEEFTDDADAVYSRFGVMFFSDATAAFANIGSALRSGGRLGFACWQAPTVNPWIAESFAVAARHIELPFGQDPTAPGPFSLADPTRLEAVLTEAGFEDVEITPHDAPSVLGADPGAAADFMVKLLPGSSSYAPDVAASLRADLAELYAPWTTDRGVESPAASWVVAATRT